MNLPVLLLLLAISLAPVRAEYRTFTNTEGRTVDAELIKADPTQAWLRLKGGRVVPIARDTLSEADQTFITTWIADKVPDLKVKPDFDRGLTKGGSDNSSVKQSFGMRVEIKNFSSKKALEESEVIYHLVGRDATDADRYKVLSRQVFELTIEPGQTKKAFFENIVNHYSESERRNNGEKSGRGHRGLGYVLQIQRKRDMRLVHLSSSTSLLDDAKEAIISLEEGDETGKTFIKPVVEPKEKKKENEKKMPQVITIK